MNEEQFYIEDGTLLRVSNLENLTEVVIPSDVKLIAPRVFANSKIRSVILNVGLEVVLNEAFYECKNLNEIVIPDTVKYIGKRSFYKSSVKRVVIGKNVSLIDESAFYDCKELKKLIFRGTNKNDKLYIDQKAFNNVYLKHL